MTRQAMRKQLGAAIRTRFSRRLAETVPELAETRGSSRAGRAHAWASSDGFACVVSLQAHDRDDATVNLAWGRATEPASLLLGTPSVFDVASAGPSGRVRLGWLMPEPRDIWWALWEPPPLHHGAWFEMQMSPPKVEDLLPRVEPIVDSVVAALVQHGLPFFARVSRRAGARPPKRWASRAASVTSPPTRCGPTGVITVVRSSEEPAPPRERPRWDDLPRVAAPRDEPVSLDELLGFSLRCIAGAHARVSSPEHARALDALVPRYTDLVRAASVVIVPWQRALRDGLTSRQRKTVDRLRGPALPDVASLLDGMAGDTERLWAEVVRSAQRISSQMRMCCRLSDDGAVRDALEPLIAVAETYQDALERAPRLR